MSASESKQGSGRRIDETHRLGSRAQEGSPRRGDHRREEDPAVRRARASDGAYGLQEGSTRVSSGSRTAALDWQSKERTVVVGARRPAPVVRTRRPSRAIVVVPAAGRQRATLVVVAPVRTPRGRRRTVVARAVVAVEGRRRAVTTRRAVVVVRAARVAAGRWTVHLSGCSASWISCGDAERGTSGSCGDGERRGGERAERRRMRSRAVQASGECAVALLLPRDSAWSGQASVVRREQGEDDSAGGELGALSLWLAWLACAR